MIEEGRIRCPKCWGELRRLRWLSVDEGRKPTNPKVHEGFMAWRCKNCLTHWYTRDTIKDRIFSGAEEVSFFYGSGTWRVEDPNRKRL